MTHAFRNYVIHSDRRDALRAGLIARGVGTAFSYTPPMHLQPVYAGKGYGRGAFPVVERSADRLLGLAIGPHLEDEQVDHAIAAVREASAA
jgi:dTDP-4-amino-4,6-dideoxygalactose transaminase